MGSATNVPPRIGISACLLGEAVRFDGGHKRDRFLIESLGRFIEFVPVCPEAECGLGTPRESMRLVRGEGGVRLITVRSRRDVTSQLDDFATERAAQLDPEDLCGFVLKKDSPSCGLHRVKVYDGDRAPKREGRGMFAARIHECVAAHARLSQGPARSRVGGGGRSGAARGAAHLAEAPHPGSKHRVSRGTDVSIALSEWGRGCGDMIGFCGQQR